MKLARQRAVPVHTLLNTRKSALAGFIFTSRGLKRKTTTKPPPLDPMTTHPTTRLEILGKLEPRVDRLRYDQLQKLMAHTLAINRGGASDYFQRL